MRFRFATITVAEGETPLCGKCFLQCKEPENEYGEFVCKSCQENANEAAYDRHMESFHEGSATQWNSLRQQQAEARKLK